MSTNNLGFYKAESFEDIQARRAQVDQMLSRYDAPERLPYHIPGLRKAETFQQIEERRKRVDQMLKEYV